MNIRRAVVFAASNFYHFLFEFCRNHNSHICWSKQRTSNGTKTREIQILLHLWFEHTHTSRVRKKSPRCTIVTCTFTISFDFWNWGEKLGHSVYCCCGRTQHDSDFQWVKSIKLVRKLHKFTAKTATFSFMCLICFWNCGKMHRIFSPLLLARALPLDRSVYLLCGFIKRAVLERAARRARDRECAHSVIDPLYALYLNPFCMLFFWIGSKWPVKAAAAAAASVEVFKVIRDVNFSHDMLDTLGHMCEWVCT